VLDGDPASPPPKKKWHSSPHIRPMTIVAKLLHQDATW